MMRRLLLRPLPALVLAAVLLAGGVVAARWLLRPTTADPGTSSLAVGRILGGTAPEGFERALGPRPFLFPQDHGPHPSFRSEWWYLTGHLEDGSGRPFGYQLTLFRTALSPLPEPDSGLEPERTSAWAAREVYLGHFTVSDLQGGRFQAAERFGRGALGLAGSQGDPLRVWVGAWSLEGQGPGQPFPLKLRAETAEQSLSLTLEPLKAPVLQGEDGWSVKGPEPGNASFYYSLPRLESRGRLRIGAETWEVAGSSWLDREWSTSALGSGLMGWDWFALQLDDGRDLMLYQLRQADGRPAPHSEGSLIEKDGQRRRLSREEFTIEVLDTWATPDGAALYPARWRLTLPREDLVLTVEPQLADQELRLSVRYWEGAVAVTGTSESRPLSGQGYVELTGYADAR